MSRYAIVALNEGGMTSGTVDNIIEITADAAIGFQLPEGHIMWACDQYPIQIGDEWNDGVFSRGGDMLTAVATVEEKVYDMEIALNALFNGEETP